MRMNQRTKVILSSIIGNALEFYDFTLYGVFAPIIAVSFFPSTDPMAAILASLIAYAVGFFMRPLGAIIFGHLGDRFGRKKALSLSIILMAFPTFILGVLPTYESIHIWAPIIVFSLRLLQGLCAGGEYTGATIFLLEHSHKKKRGFWGSFATVSGAGGSLIAALLGYVILQPGLPHWAWRIPFILGVVLGFIGLYIRLKIEETPEFKKEVLDQKKPTKLPILEVFKTYPEALFQCIVGASLCGALASTFVAYVNVYLTRFVGLVAVQSMLLTSIGLLVIVTTSPLMGYLSDRYGLKRVMSLSCMALFIAAAYPIFSLFQSEDLNLIIFAQCLFGLCATGFIAPFNAFMSSVFPVRVRYTGTSLGYNIGMAVFGGTTPVTLTYLLEKTGNLMIPAFYMMGFAFVGFVIFFTWKKSSERVSEQSA